MIWTQVLDLRLEGGGGGGGGGYMDSGDMDSGVRPEA